MGDAESDEHLRIFKCLIDTGSHVLRNAIVIKVLNNNSNRFVQYLENNKHQFYHQFEKNIRRKCCLGSPHGCNFKGIMDKKIFYKMYNKTAEQNTQDCLDRFEIKAGISLDILDLSDLNFFLWNSGTLSTQEENSLMKIMSIRSEICHPSSSHSYSINELERYWSDLKSAVLLFAEPKCYKDIVEMQIETLQNCKLNVVESAKIIQKMRTESDKILHAIKQETPLKIVDIEKLIKDGTYGLKNCIRSENNKTKSYINDTFQEFKENIGKHQQVLSTRCREEIQTTVTQESSNTRLHSEDQRRAIDTKLTESENRVCQTVIQSRGRLEDTIIEQQNETRKHTVELNADVLDLMEENRKLTAEVMEMKTDMKELKTILIGHVGKQKVDLVMNTEQIEKSTNSPDNRKVDITVKFNQTHVTEDKENEIIENLPPEIKILTNNDSSPEAAVTETIEITGKKVNSIILELKATPGILHSEETFKAAMLTLVQNIQTAGGIDVDIEDTVTVNLSFESPLTEDQFTVVKCLFAKEWNDDNNTKQLSDEYSFISDEYSSTSDEYLSTEDVNEMEFRSELDNYSQKESEVFQPKTTEPLTKTSCQFCDDKDKIIKALEEQSEKYETVNKRNMLYLQAENSNLRALLIRTRPDNTGMISVTEKLGMKVKGLKSDDWSSLESEHTYNQLEKEKSQRDQLEKEKSQRYTPEKEKSLRAALLERTRLDNIGMISVKEKLRMKQKRIKSDDSSSLESEEKNDQQEEYRILRDSSSQTTLYECRSCYEKNEIIIQLDRRLCEIRRRIMEGKGKSLSGNNFFEDLLEITHQNTSMTSVEDKGRMKDKELKSDISSQKSELIYDSDVRNPETKAKMNLMELQHSKVPGAGFDQPENKSELSLRISELRREYARNSYTKTEEQKGLAIILQRDSTRYISHSGNPDTPHLQQFFEEMGFVVKCMDDIKYGQSYTYIANEKVYCIFIVLTGYNHRVYEHIDILNHLLFSRVQGKPTIVMSDSTNRVFGLKELAEQPDTLLLSPWDPFTGRYQILEGVNIFDDFMKVTRSNRFSDIMDILTRMNALHDRPVITFQSTFRKKLYFL